MTKTNAKLALCGMSFRIIVTLLNGTSCDRMEKYTSASDGFETQNPNLTEADFSWLCHIPTHI